MSFLDAHFPQVAAKLQRVRATGERTARASCPSPAHRRGDRNPSLLLKLADNGGLIFSCRAGCGKDQVLAALGLRWRDLCHDRPREGRIMSRLVKTYPYRTPDGVTSFEVCRYHPKQGFPPRRKLPQCGGDWVYSIVGGPVRRVEARQEESGYKAVRYDGVWQPGDPCPAGCVMTAPAELWPYNADLLAAEPERIAFWCEGEKDADNLRKLGLLATTTQGGAGVAQKEGAAAWKRAWNKLFRDRTVVVVPDNDPAGYGYAAWAIGCLVMAGCQGVIPLRLKGMRPKGDVSDYLFDRFPEADRQGHDSPAARHVRQLVAKANGLTRQAAAEMFRNPAAKAARAVDPQAAYRDNEGE